MVSIMIKEAKRQVIFLSLIIVFVIAILATSSYAWFVVTDDGKDTSVKFTSANLRTGRVFTLAS